MNKRKVIFLVVLYSLLAIGVGALIFWGVNNAKKLKSALNGTNLYTKEDLDNSYNDGYKDALEDKDAYIALINEYKATILNLTDSNTQLKSQITKVKNENADQKTKITALTGERDNLTAQVEALSADKTANQATINELNSKIDTLNSQIEELTTKYESNKNVVDELNKQIEDLQATIEYYKNNIKQLESDTQAFATFEYDGKVIDIKCVTKGTTVSINQPESTEYVVFNGWKVDGEFIDLATYNINTNTTFVADLTYKYKVAFNIDKTTEYDSQVVLKGSYPTLPNAPTKDGYEFDGWTIDGENVITNIQTIPVNSHVTYIAKFTKLINVKFVYENSVIDTQTVRNGSFAKDVSVINTTYKVFNGWKYNSLDSQIVDVDTVQIFDLSNENIFEHTFYADITYYFDVKFIVENQEYTTLIVQENNHPIPPTEPTKEGFKFVGWFNGTEIVDLTSLQVTENITLVAKFVKTYTVRFIDRGNEISTLLAAENDVVPTVDVATRDGYDFVGWSVDGKTKIDSTTTVKSDMTLKALWGHSVSSGMVSIPLRRNIFWYDGSNPVTYDSIFYELENQDYTIDLTKSSITYIVSTSTGFGVSGESPELITIDKTNLGVTNICTGQQDSNLLTTGSCRIKVDVDGSLTFEQNDYMVKYNNNNASYNKYISVGVKSYSLYIISST